MELALGSHNRQLINIASREEDPLLHDCLVRRFQEPSERAADVAKKGYAGVLEADLWRSEAKMEALRRDSAAKPARGAALPGSGMDEEDETGTRSTSDRNGRIYDDDIYEAPANKEEGLRMWREEMEMRFLAGLDEDFEYDIVDAGQEDEGSEEEREEEEKWFNEEEESWLEAGDGGEENENGLRPALKGETGVQDF